MTEPFSRGRGGAASSVLQWVLGLDRLGHTVYFVEFLKEDPGQERNAAISFFRETMESWWRPDRSALLVEPTLESLYGADRSGVERLADKAAAIITFAAPLRPHPFPLIEAVRPRILIETDPGYTHLWAADGNTRDVFGEQDLYFTVGGNIGSPRCSLPTLGIDWKPVFNPVVLDLWPVDSGIGRDRFTTVADWRSYGYLEWEGQVLGPKAEEFRKFIDLPQLAREPVEIALNIDSEDPDLPLLRHHGWRIENPELIRTPDQYRAYVSGSLGEFSCVKGGYAGTRSGWFSDRSAAYLASGRPVVLQSTGFEDLLPTGRGLFAVTTVDEAAEAIKAIRSDYALHSAAAHAVAREHLASAKILGHVLAEAGIG